MGELPLKRSGLELRIDVLTAINEGISKPTLIMYRSNLSWAPLSKILKEFTERGLVKCVKGKSRATYLLTDRGHEILKESDILRQFVWSEDPK